MRISDWSSDVCSSDLGSRWSSASSPTKATAWPARSRRCGVRRTERKEGAVDSWVQFFLIVVGLPVVLGIGSDMYPRHLKLEERQLTAISPSTATKAEQNAAQHERTEASHAGKRRSRTTK